MKIIEFIRNFNSYQGSKGFDILREQFMNGWCYYFAKMLETAFPGGEVCLCYPYSHIVYLYENKAYDFEGESDTEAEFLIPISKFPNIAKDFMRNDSGKSDYDSKEKIEKLGKDAYQFSYVFDPKSETWVKSNKAIWK